MSTNANTTVQLRSNKRGKRLGAVIAAVAAAVAGWLLIEVVAGVDLRAPAFDARTGSQDIGLSAVLLTSLVASLAAWGLLAVSERYLPRSRRIWTVLAAAGLVLSLGGPMSGTDIETSRRVLLLALHVIVAAVLIPILYRTATTPPERTKK